MKQVWVQDRRLARCNPWHCQTAVGCHARSKGAGYFKDQILAVYIIVNCSCDQLRLVVGPAPGEQCGQMVWLG